MVERKSNRRDWNCNRECLANCCSYVILDVRDDVALGMWRELGMMLVPKDYTDWTWLSYHKGIIIERQVDERVLIKAGSGVDWRLEQNPHNGVWYVFFGIPCRYLRGNLCSIYSRRPALCRVAVCSWKNVNPVIEWCGSFMKCRGKDNGKEEK